MIHGSCVANQVQRVSEFIRVRFSEIDTLIAGIKIDLLGAHPRIAPFRREAGFSLPARIRSQYQDARLFAVNVSVRGTLEQPQNHPVGIPEASDSSDWFRRDFRSITMTVPQ